MTNTPDNRRPQFAAEDYEGAAQAHFRDATTSNMLRAAADLAREVVDLKGRLDEIAWECDGEEDITASGGPNLAMRVLRHASGESPNGIRETLRHAESRESELREKVRKLEAKVQDWKDWLAGMCV